MEQAITITDVNTEDVDILWPKIKDNIQLALDQGQGEFTLEDVHYGLVSGDMRLWISYNPDGILLASAVCEIKQFPRKKVCYVLFSGGGTFDVWIQGSHLIEAWARENGAETIAAFTRKGVAKKMEVYGYEAVYTVIQKELTDQQIH